MAIAPITFRLTDPGFTIYHRAALGGLAATIRAWRNHGVPPPVRFEKLGSGGRLSSPEGVHVEIDMSSTEVRLNWPVETPDRQALALLLSVSFRLTDDGMIFLPGQGFGPDREDILLAIHERLTQTFLQHNQKRRVVGIREVAIAVDDPERPVLFRYKKLEIFSHQVAQGTGLLGKGWEIEIGPVPNSVDLSQSILPGTMDGARKISARSTDAFLLQFVMVACPAFRVNSHRRDGKIQSCIVVPDVDDLERFSRRLHRLGADPVSRLSNTHVGRVVGGSEEAALRFSLDLRAADTGTALGVSSFLTIGMGRVPWDKKQQNRSAVARVRADYGEKELAVFEASATHLGRARVITTKKGQFIVPDNPVPELIAANLANDRHWCSQFCDLVAEKSGFSELLFRSRGLNAMKDAVRDNEDRLVIDRFQKAWKLTMSALAKRASSEGLDFKRLVKVERERIRNDLLRTRTADQLAGWLLNFMARATREKPTPKAFQEEADTFRKFLFDARNGDRLKNLLLFALVSYRSKKRTDGGDGGKTNHSHPSDNQ